MPPKRKAADGDSTIPSQKAKCSTGSDSDRTNWEEVEFVIKSRDNNLPNPYGTVSTTTGPLKWADVAGHFNQRFGKTIGAAACEKRYRQKLDEYRQRDPMYPDPKVIIYAAKAKPTKKAASKSTQRAQPPTSQCFHLPKPLSSELPRKPLGKQCVDGSAPQDSERGHNEKSIEDSNCDNENAQLSDSQTCIAESDDKIVAPNPGAQHQRPLNNPDDEMAPGSLFRKRFVDEQLKKFAPVCEQMLPKELREIAKPEFYFEYGGAVKKTEFHKWVTFDVTTSDGLQCGSVDMLSRDIRANSDIVEAALLHDRRIGVHLEVQGYSKSIVELFAQCCQPSIDRDSLPECLPACMANKKRMLSLEKADYAISPLCLPECLQNQQVHAHIPYDTCREEYPQYLRRRTGPYLLPEYHYTLVRQRQTDGTLRLLPVVRRIAWTMDELVELYLLATELKAGHIRSTVVHRWFQFMERAAPPLEFYPETLNRLFSHPEVGHGLKKLFAQWVHKQGLADFILDSDEEWEKDFSQILYRFRHGFERSLLILPLHGQMPNQYEPDLKALTIRLLHAARRDYTSACDQLVTQLLAGKKRAPSKSSTDIEGAEQLCQEFREKKDFLHPFPGQG